MSLVNSRMIEYASNGHTTPGYLATPGDRGRHPGVVVIQEWWGLVPHIEEVCQRFAEAGFVALAPDLYHGQKTDEPDEARKMAMSLDIERALQEIRTAAIHLQGMPEVSPGKIGIVGWCMGGMASLQIAVNPGAANIGAVVAFYGRPPADEEVQDIDVPVLGLYGELDQGIPVDTVRAFEQELRAQGKTHAIHIYAGANHAFFNDTRPQAYHAQASADAWEKTLAWFGRYLR